MTRMVRTAGIAARNVPDEARHVRVLFRADSEDAGSEMVGTVKIEWERLGDVCHMARALPDVTCIEVHRVADQPGDETLLASLYNHGGDRWRVSMYAAGLRASAVAALYDAAGDI